MIHDQGAAPGRRVHVVQGQYAVSDDAEVCLTTVLGSCVAACLWDPDVGVGGMNHFLLPEAPDGRSDDRRYGVQAMELLINDLLKRGALRGRLQAKVFGGARMNTGMVDIGARNASFVRRYLADEGVTLSGGDLGGGSARRVQFWPVSGRARQHLVAAAPAPLPPPPVVDARASAGELELF